MGRSTKNVGRPRSSLLGASVVIAHCVDAQRPHVSAQDVCDDPSSDFLPADQRARLTISP